jgi:hypothetical protein
MRVMGLMLLACLLAGCASPTSTQFSVPAGEYSKAFDATRDLLRSYRFTLERVDAAAGVITTGYKTTAGLATPWDAEQSSLSQEFQDLLNQQSRRVRVTFRPAVSGEDEHPVDQPIDPKEALVGRVEVIIYRMQTPGLRSPSRAILLTTLATDPALTEEGIPGQYAVPVSQDSSFAARLAKKIEGRLGTVRAAGADIQPLPERVARP